MTNSGLCEKCYPIDPSIGNYYSLYSCKKLILFVAHLDSCAICLKPVLNEKLITTFAKSVSRKKPLYTTPRRYCERNKKETDSSRYGCKENHRFCIACVRSLHLDSESGKQMRLNDCVVSLLNIVSDKFMQSVILMQ